MDFFLGVQLHFTIDHFLFFAKQFDFADKFFIPFVCVIIECDLFRHSYPLFLFAVNTAYNILFYTSI